MAHNLISGWNDDDMTHGSAFLWVSVGNHVDAVEAARLRRKRGLTKVKNASRMLADSMAEVSM